MSILENVARDGMYWENKYREGQKEIQLLKEIISIIKKENDMLLQELLSFKQESRHVYY